MAEPLIYVIPEEYYAGAAPKPKPQKMEESAGHGFAPVQAVPVQSKVTPKVLFIVIMGGLFLVVVGIATWYFTRGLRKPVSAPPPVREVPAEAGLPPPSPIEPEIVEPVEPAPPPLPPSTDQKPDVPLTPSLPSFYEDRDNDGLTEAEEQLYGSGATIPDTDHDGFLDGHEVLHLYNPSGLAPETLEATGFVARFRHSQNSYELLYPKPWQTTSDPESAAVNFKDSGGQEITVSVVENTGSLSLNQWVADNWRGTPVAWTSNKTGAEGLVVQDGPAIQAAFGKGTRIYMFRYNLMKADAEGRGSTTAAPAFKRTLEMMLNSFRIL